VPLCAVRRAAESSIGDKNLGTVHMSRPLYLDYNSTAPLDERVFEAMRPYFLEEFGNAGSRTHSYGQRAKEGAEQAREQVAKLLGVRPDEVVFTSGATEANNLAILGLAAHGEATGRKHVLATAIEHKAVLEPLERLRAAGFSVELVPVTAGGYVEPDAVKARLRPDTLLVSVMQANNETGVLQPVREIAALLEGSATFFHVDAAQTYGKEVQALRALPYDFLSVSGHKIYGPKGVGALVARRRGGQKRPLTALTVGGGQEMGLRPGILPVPLVVGLGEAARLAGEEHAKRNADARRVKEDFLCGLVAAEHVINGDPARTQPHVVNVRFPGVDSEALMLSVRETVAISNGAACTSASYSPSHVLKAMGLSDDDVASSVRISWGPGVEAIPTESIVAAVRNLRI
jgi:cysteine desulfurase